MSMVDHVYHSINSSKMITLQAVLLLSVGIASTVAYDPDCSTCVYHNNIGFVEGEFCHDYFMCIKNQADNYRSQRFCCADGLSWDQQHLTCKRDGKCQDPRDKCPNVTSTTDLPCPYKEDPDDKAKFFTSTHEQMECPWGQIWSQDDCTCILGQGVLDKPCDKILSFDFNGTYDSFSCHNFAKGEPYGEPSLEDDVLCLNGEDQFLTIGFLNNYFAWNPQARTFTLCVWFMSYKHFQNASIVSTNCDMQDPQTGASGSVADIFIEDGFIVLYLGPDRVATGMKAPGKAWVKLCVVFDNGVFNVYLNGASHASVSTLPYKFAPNTHSATTLGFKPGSNVFHGYIDDFCFYTEAKSPEFIKDCYDDGPSNTFVAAGGDST